MPPAVPATRIVAAPGLRVAEDSVFFLASISKAIVATAVMQYVDEGRLDVHAPLVRYLPELDGGAAGVSAWHVLTHTSGLPDIPLETLRRERPAYRKTVAFVAGSQPAWPPGSRYEYNSAAWVLLSEVMARLSGMPFAEALALRLTRPLGMVDTSFDPRSRRSRIVPGAGLADGQPAGAGAAAALPGPGTAARRRALRQPPGPAAPGRGPCCRPMARRAARAS